MVRVNSAANEYQTMLATVADASSKLGGTLPITEGGTALPLTTGTNLGSSGFAAFYNNARLDQVLMSVPNPLVNRYYSPSFGSQSFARADSATGGDLTYNEATGRWASVDADTTITATMSYAACTRLECAAINNATTPGVDGTNFRINGGATGLTNGGRVAYIVYKAVPAQEAFQLAKKLNGNALMTDTSGAGTVAQTNGICAYQAATTGTTDVYVFLGSF